MVGKLERCKNSSGMLTIWVIVVLTLLFAFGAIALDTTLYLLKRREVRILAESVAMAASNVLPFKGGLTQNSPPFATGTVQSALRWYDALRFDYSGNEIAPALTSCTAVVNNFECLNADGKKTLDINFNDNQGVTSQPADLDTIYKNISLEIAITIDFDAGIFPVLGHTFANINVMGKATTQLAPTDIVLVVENSASFIDTSLSIPPLGDFSVKFGATLGSTYAHQCFSEPWRNFKQGVLELYDRLSQNDLYRVAVVTTHSRSGEPFILADLGQTVIPVEELEEGATIDQPDDHSVRCRALTLDLTTGAIPYNINYTNNVWGSRRELASVASPANPPSQPFDLPAGFLLLVREAIWLLQAGYSTESGYISPRYYYSNTRAAIDIAKRMLYVTRRPDNLAVQNRVIIVLTDDTGMVPGDMLNPETMGTTEVTQNICKYWYENSTNDQYEEQIKLGVVLYGHTTNPPLRFHDYTDDQVGEPMYDFRTDCMKEMNYLAGTPSRIRQGIFLVEHSPASPFIPTTFHPFDPQDFYLHATPLVAQALKEVEFRK